LCLRFSFAGLGWRRSSSICKTQEWIRFGGQTNRYTNGYQHNSPEADTKPHPVPRPNETTVVQISSPHSSQQRKILLPIQHVLATHGAASQLPRLAALAPVLQHRCSPYPAKFALCPKVIVFNSCRPFLRLHAAASAGPAAGTEKCFGSLRRGELCHAQPFRAGKNPAAAARQNTAGERVHT
jgi:hypothetical protein